MRTETCYLGIPGTLATRPYGGDLLKRTASQRDTRSIPPLSMARKASTETGGIFERMVIVPLQIPEAAFHASCRMIAGSNDLFGMTSALSAILTSLPWRRFARYPPITWQPNRLRNQRPARTRLRFVLLLRSNQCTVLLLGVLAPNIAESLPGRVWQATCTYDPGVDCQGLPSRGFVECWFGGTTETGRSEGYAAGPSCPCPDVRTTSGSHVHHNQPVVQVGLLRKLG